jgi:hypothetical protein
MSDWACGRGAKSGAVRGHAQSGGPDVWLGARHMGGLPSGDNCREAVAEHRCCGWHGSGNRLLPALRGRSVSCHDFCKGSAGVAARWVPHTRTHKQVRRPPHNVRPSPVLWQAAVCNAPRRPFPPSRVPFEGIVWKSRLTSNAETSCGWIRSPRTSTIPLESRSSV